MLKRKHIYQENEFSLNATEFSVEEGITAEHSLNTIMDDEVGMTIEESKELVRLASSIYQENEDSLVASEKAVEESIEEDSKMAEPLISTASNIEDESDSETKERSVDRLQTQNLIAMVSDICQENTSTDNKVGMTIDESQELVQQVSNIYQENEFLLKLYLSFIKLYEFNSNIILINLVVFFRLTAVVFFYFSFDY